jgi:hypothetical protein
MLIAVYKEEQTQNGGYKAYGMDVFSDGKVEVSLRLSS